MAESSHGVGAAFRFTLHHHVWLTVVTSHYIIFIIEREIVDNLFNFDGTSFGTVNRQCSNIVQVHRIPVGILHQDRHEDIAFTIFTQWYTVRCRTKGISNLLAGNTQAQTFFL